MLRKFAIAALFAFATAPAMAQDTWPDRPIRMVVHVSAGGGFDLLARVLADRLSQQLPQRVVVENMPGAGGAIAGRAIAKASPDGYTFLFVGPSHASVPYMHKQPPYDPINDFAPVSLVAQFSQLLLVKSALPAKNLSEFIALAKADPGKITFGSSGVGSAGHIPAEMLIYHAGVKLTHVPYRGNSQATAGVIAGEIDVLFDGLAPQLGNIESGRLRVLGVTTKERSPFLPDVPAMTELLPGYEFPLWVGVFAPAQTPKPIVDRLAAEIRKALEEPTTNKRYTDIKVEAIGSSPEQFDKFFREQLKFNEEAIRRANIELQ
jgi:tripartite-type tricarboxylate transporter receptor subunit TctC